MISNGSIVIYKNQPAIIIESGEKYTIQFASGPKLQNATQSVRQKDFVLLCDKSASASLQPKELLANAEVFLEKSETYFDSAKEVAELLISDGNAPAAISELSELVFGSFVRCTIIL